MKTEGQIKGKTMLKRVGERQRDRQRQRQTDRQTDRQTGRGRQLVIGRHRNYAKDEGIEGD